MGAAMFNLDGGPNQLFTLNSAFSQLCPPGATEAERDRVQLTIFGLMHDDGLMTVETLVARAGALLEVKPRAGRAHAARSAS